MHENVCSYQIIIIPISIQKYVLLPDSVLPMSHMTPCPPNECNSYFTNSHATVFSQSGPDIHSPKPHFDFPLLMLFQRTHPSPRPYLPIHNTVSLKTNPLLTPKTEKCCA
jgi:hypothetical protein